MKTLHELFHSVDKASVYTLLMADYDESDLDFDGYDDAWNKILSLTPVQSNMTIELTFYVHEIDKKFDNTPRVDVSGRLKGASYGLDFVAWDKWLGMPVQIGKSDKEFSDVEIVAHCLYEMTWHGYNQEPIGERLVEILDSVKSIRNQFNN